MNEPARILAEVTSYTELTAALRARADELQLSGKSLDDISGLADGYFQKLIGPVPQRTLGPGMLDAVLATLCVKLAVIHDQGSLDKLQHRFVERDERRVRKPPSVVTFTTRTFQAIGRKGGEARAKKLTADQRRAIASIAGKAGMRQKPPDHQSKAAKAKWARIRAKQKEVEANQLDGDLSQLERKIREQDT